MLWTTSVVNALQFPQQMGSWEIQKPWVMVRNLLYFSVFTRNYMIICRLLVHNASLCGYRILWHSRQCLSWNMLPSEFNQTGKMWVQLPQMLWTTGHGKFESHELWFVICCFYRYLHERVWFVRLFVRNVSLCGYRIVWHSRQSLSWNMLPSLYRTRAGKASWIFLNESNICALWDIRRIKMISIASCWTGIRISWQYTWILEVLPNNRCGMLIHLLTSRIKRDPLLHS